jgi:hypothetical protein
MLQANVFPSLDIRSGPKVWFLSIVIWLPLRVIRWTVWLC